MYAFNKKRMAIDHPFFVGFVSCVVVIHFRGKMLVFSCTLLRISYKAMIKTACILLNGVVWFLREEKLLQG